MKNMINKKTWKEFRDSGLLWFVNTILHMFGWAIIFSYDKESGEITEVYPARVKFRGFDEETTTNGYVQVSQYLKENIDQLLKEAKDEI